MQKTSCKILIPQTRIESAHAPYIALTKKYNLTIDFHPFTSIGPVPTFEFRKFKKDILHKKVALIFTNKIAIDRFFKLAEEIKIKLSEETRYFCATEQLKNYLQKYIILKQRKVIHGTKNIQDIYPKIKKFKDFNFLFPCSNTRRKTFYEFFKTNNLSYKEIPTYQTDFNDLSQLPHQEYQLILFFSPLEIRAMVKHFPDFRPNTTQIAIFGTTTAEVAQQIGWHANIKAPTKEVPSLVDALDLYFRDKKI